MERRSAPYRARLVIFTALLAGLAFSSPVHAQDESPAAEQGPSADVAVVTLEEGTEAPVELTESTNGAWRETPVVETDSFGLTGLAWDSGDLTAVQVRTRAADGSWSDWETVHVAEGGEDGAPAPTVQASEPLWAGLGSTAAQYRVVGDAPNARVVLLAADPPEATPTESTTAVTDNGVTVNLRSSWDTSDCRNPSATVGYSTVKFSVVHHTASSNAYSQADVPGIIHAICLYHVNTQGWDDIAYNFIVDKYGGVWEGRTGGIDLPVRGAHSAGFNSFSAGFALIGDHSAVQPSSSALQSLGEIIGWKMWLEGKPVVGTVKVTSLGSAKWPEGTVVSLNRVSGHRDVQSTSCPGDAAYDDLWLIRTTAKAEKQSLPKTLLGTSGDFDGDGDLDGAVLIDSGKVKVAKGKTSSFGSPTKWADVAKPGGLRHALSGDFNGDGDDDIAFLRKSSGKWKVGISTGTKFNVGTWHDFANPNSLHDHLVGDFNGDGKDDIASFRTSRGMWKVAISNGGAFTVTTWYDFANDTKLGKHFVGDFNGDGRDDVASFRSSSGLWKVGISTGTSFDVTTWYDFTNLDGLGKHVVGDFNNDGLDDIASFRRHNGAWKVALSKGSKFTATVWAKLDPDEEWTTALTGDFHGNGRHDIAHFAASDGEWFILKANTDNSFTIIEAADAPRTKKWGTSGPLSGDSDDDLALARPTGAWIGHIANDGSFDIWLP